MGKFIDRIGKLNLIHSFVCCVLVIVLRFFWPLEIAAASAFGSTLIVRLVYDLCTNVKNMDPIEAFAFSVFGAVFGTLIAGFLI